MNGVRGVGGGALLVLLLVLLVACGGSVADSDRAAPPPEEPAAPTAFCAALAANGEALEPILALRAGGGLPPEELSNTVDAVRRTADDMITAAPNELRADVESFVRAIDLQLDALVASGGDVAALQDPALQAELSTPEIDAAGARVEAYAQRTCAPAAG